jgi:hypothetical protein
MSNPLENCATKISSSKARSGSTGVGCVAVWNPLDGPTVSSSSSVSGPVANRGIDGDLSDSSVSARLLGAVKSEGPASCKRCSGC